jgi:hypothetical protein
MAEDAQSTADTLYERLILNDCRRYVPGLTRPTEAFPEEDLRLLILSASMLAMQASGSREGARASRRAYDIATRLPEFANGSSASMLVAADYILTELGNFPGRTLLRSNGDNPVTAEQIARTHPFVALRMIARESDNTTPLTQQLLTDFQIDLLDKLGASRSVSFSAPTSAGKSTVLELEIIRSLQAGERRLAILVPTRALIRQVTFDLIDFLNQAGLGGVPVPSAPDPAQIAASRSVVCVFTQERLQTLLSNPEWGSDIDDLIVDEAQEIGEGARGQTLELVISQVLSRYPNCRVRFSSPLRSNPEYLLSTVGRLDGGVALVDHSAPVTQNIFVVDRILNKPQRATYSVLLDGAVKSLGDTDLPFKFRGTKCLADFALLLTRAGDSSIIYADGAAKAENLADQIAAELPEVSAQGIDELIEFVTGHIHRDYHLAEVVSKGVGFHYGKLPQIVRAKVEDLLRDRHIRFVCCTSTLLQGVNLPTKNIFVENPKRGKGQPMTPGDFWNLIGRAGRLAKEFQGNIFCINKGAWESDPFGTTRFFPLRSAFEDATTNQAATLLTVAESPPVSSESDFQWAEQALARIFLDYTVQGTGVADSRYATSENRSTLLKIDQACQKISAGKTLPLDVYRKNPYLLPTRLDELANFFRSQRSLVEWIPPMPFVSKSYQRYEPIFGAIETVFIRAEYDRHKYFAVLALQWMTGYSLKQLIANRLEFRNIAADDKRQINNHIRGLFEDIEDVVRYVYVKYFKVYADVLRPVLEERSQNALSAKIPSIHLFLEYGAASQTLINLMGLGLSRTSAVLLKSHLSLADDLDASTCQNRIERASLTTSDLPALCRAEITRLRRQRH